MHARPVWIRSHPILHAGGLGVAGSVDDRVAVDVAPLLLLLVMVLVLVLVLLLVLLLLLVMMQWVRRSDRRDVVGDWPVVVVAMV